MLKKIHFLSVKHNKRQTQQHNFIEFLLKKWFYLFKILLSKPQLKPTT